MMLLRQRQEQQKNLTQSAETRQDLEGLQNRIKRLEKGGGSSSGSSQARRDLWFRAKSERNALKTKNNLSTSQFDV